MIDLKKLSSLSPKSDWIKLNTIEAHTGGEPLRVILSGYPTLKGRTILEKREEINNKFDHLRTSLMWEPRGHIDMYGALLVEPEKTTSDIGVIFMHNSGYSTGCGHAVIALTKIIVESGAVEIKDPVTEIVMDVPSGQIKSFAKISNKKVDSVYFENVPSFVQELGAIIDIPSLGKVEYDLAFGGAFYAIVDIKQLNVNLEIAQLNQIISMGKKIKKRISERVDCVHPFEKEMNFLYGVIFVDNSFSQKFHSKNICIFANGELDRSPTGTGVSARAAVEFAKENLDSNNYMVVESITGSKFNVRIKKETKLGKRMAIIPEVSGTSFIIGKSTFWVDPKDDLGNGFLLA